MSEIINRLEKILNLEVELGYQNKAVIGGLRGLLDWWPNQARNVCPQDQHQVIEQIVSLIDQYGNVGQVEQRTQIIAQVRQHLSRLKSAGGAPVAEKPAPTTTPTPPAAPPPASP